MQKSAPPSEEPAAAPRGRGRPRAFARCEALAAAMRVFWRKGYAAISIGDLTAAMGIGATSLYAAFGSKEALYAEALEHYGTLYEPEIWGRFEAAATARDAVEALLMGTACAFSRACEGDYPRGCMVTMSAAGEEGHPELGELVRGKRAAGLRRLEDRLRAAPLEELPVGADPAVLARFILSVQAGMSIQARDGASGEELAATARTALALWDAGLTA